ncbi:capsular biosynthesis protein [Halalkalibacillus sediminis]|uniref:Capsular biosynthesis protein n=1 Tax=Halalkalibacillus sediminis TaxID=2018042 RepID=A0A2I0QTZ7_9BACI|nr:Wzz/FepE/Etk N-terminal domain-containing protein [Halalkalibacillus sediminis]PKR77822.1 capsular biosynthesis protein [Halalkalibacillus sediminis]
MEESISLQEIFAALKKRLGIIIIITLSFVLIGLVYTLFFTTPQYEASSQFIVNQSVEQESTRYDVNEIRSSVELINTYNVILTSPVILNEVINKLDLDITSNQLASKINVSSASGSQVVNVRVTDSDPAQVAHIANLTVETFRDEIPDILNVDNVSVLSKAEYTSNPNKVSPNTQLNLAIAFVLGLMISMGIAFLQEVLDTSLKEEQDIERTLALPIMGRISTINEREIRKRNQKHRRGIL